MDGRHLKSLKRAAKQILSPLLDATGLPDRWIAAQSGRPGTWTILTYHRIVDGPGLDPFALGMCVGRRHFATQLDFLASRFTIETVASVAARIARGEPVSSNTLSITIDDGYKDNIEVAAPMLLQRGIPASIYVATGGLEDGAPFWWDRVISAVNHTPRTGSVASAEFGLPADDVALSLRASHRGATAEHLLETLWQLPHPEVLAAVERIERLLEPDRPATLLAPRMAPDDIARLAAQGFEIGAHSVAHPNLTRLPSDEVALQMTHSRDRLATLTGGPVVGFVYPAGLTDASVTSLARELGFGYALSSDTGVNRPSYDMYRLARIGPPDAPLADFKRALSRAMRFVPTRGLLPNEGMMVR
jgi:peptidoglycan/xylan/chitin deacetylase (PgdA/CDA1 family)